MTRLLTATLAVLALGACAMPEPGSPAWIAHQESKREQARADAAKEAVAQAPAWFAGRADDEYAIYGVGTATSAESRRRGSAATRRSGRKFPRDWRAREKHRPE